MAIHSSTLAWKIPWREELDRLQSMGSKELDTTEWLHSCIADGFLTNWAIPQLPNGNILEKPLCNIKTRMLTLIKSTNLLQIYTCTRVCLYLVLYSFSLCIPPQSKYRTAPLLQWSPVFVPTLRREVPHFLCPKSLAPTTLFSVSVCLTTLDTS